LEEAHLGLQKALGDDNGDTLDALDNLGRTIGRYWDNESLERAYAYHKTAIAGMEKLHGKDHERTMQAQENLVRITIALGGPRVKEVDVIMAGVVKGRRRKLGKEHPLTLHAMCSHALVKIALGELSAAESLVMTGLPIAIRNLTMEHVGTLWGRMTLGSIRIAQNRLDEAEEILIDVAARQNVTLQDGTDMHPDRLGTLAELAKCYRLQGKFEASIIRCDEALKGYEARDHADHPLARNARVAKQRLADHLKAIQEGETGDPEVGRPLEGGYRMYEVL
jgi:tetratricopeptide (TPR) repeat protein